MQYLAKHGMSDITRDHFSFSAKIKVGDFYEARDGPQVISSMCFCPFISFVFGVLTIIAYFPTLKYVDLFQGSQWYLLNEEEVVSRILAMEGRRGRPRNVPAVSPSHSDRRVCGVDESKADGLSVSEVKLLRRLEAQGTADLSQAQIDTTRVTLAIVHVLCT